MQGKPQQLVRAQPGQRRPARAQKDKEPELVLGLVTDETVAAIARYGVVSLVVVGGFWASGLSLSSLWNAPRRAAGELWEWSFGNKE